MSWACVMFEDKLKEAVHVEDIQKFNAEAYDPMKQYYVRRDPDIYSKALVLFLRGIN